MRRTPLLLLVLVVATLTACGDLFEPAAAVVNGDKISTEEVKRDFEKFKDSPQYEAVAAQGSPGQIARQYQQAYISREIRKRILRAAAERQGIEVSDDEVNKRIDSIKKEFQSEKQFEEAVVAQGLTLDRLPGIIEDLIIEEKLRAKVTAEDVAAEDEVRAYYERHKDDYAETRVQHILTKQSERANELSNQLQAASKGQVDALFKRLASRFSEDPSTARKGGDLGYSTLERFLKPFADAAARLKEGEVSDPVRTEFGYHVIRVVDRRVKSFEDVKDEIQKRLSEGAQEQAWQKWLVEAYENADIDVSPQYGKLDLKTQQVVDVSRPDIPGTEDRPPADLPG